MGIKRTLGAILAGTGLLVVLGTGFNCTRKHVNIQREILDLQRKSNQLKMYDLVKGLIADNDGKPASTSRQDWEIAYNQAFGIGFDKNTYPEDLTFDQLNLISKDYFNRQKEKRKTEYFESR
ncbi:MAG: hypothetical protein AABW89_04105 [Nanoarchaeota archaeon]